MRNRVTNDGFISDRNTEDFSFIVEGDIQISGSTSLSGSLALTSNLFITGNVDATGKGLFKSGLTGALNVLPGGTPYLSAGIGGVTLATGSSGQITISVISSSNFNVSSSSGSMALGSNLSNYVIFLDASTSPFTITLPNAATGGSGSFFHLKKTDSTNNSVTVSASNAQLIDGQPTQVISLPYTSIKLVSNNNAWWLL